jgi:predicted nucleic acid-binding protein
VASLDRVILDTSALLALLDADDEFHEQASMLHDQLLDGSCELWVSSYILVETIALAHRRLGFGPLSDLVDSLDASTTTAWVDEQLHQAIWEEFNRRRGRRFSFVDCSTLLIARSLNATVFAFDSDFSLEGLPVIP